MAYTRFSIVIAALLALVTLVSGAWAQSYDISITDISVSPESPVVGDSLTITVSFDIDAPSDPNVFLRLYIDSSLKDSYTAAFEPGSHSVEFTIGTSYISSGEHKIKAEADLKVDSEKKDSDTETKTFTLTSVTAEHDLDVVQASHKITVAPGERFSVDVTVRNSGNVRESTVQILIKLDGTTKYSGAFDLERNESESRTLYITAPQTAGTYDLLIKTFNANDYDSMTSSVTVGTAELSISASSTEIGIGDFVRIWGFANANNKAVTSVAIYKDGVSVGSVKPDSSGYWSTFVRLYESGWHSVTAKAGGAEKSLNIYARAETSGTVTTDGSTTTTTTTTTTAQTQTPSGFVNVDVSSKEVDAEQYKGNIVNIRIENHLGASEVFKVTTSLPESIVFLPHAEIIDDEEAAVFRVFISPGENLTFDDGELYVVQGTTSIKTIPVSLFVAPTPDREARLPAPIALIGDIGMAGFAFLLSALVLVVAFLALRRTDFRDIRDVLGFRGLLRPLRKIQRSSLRPAPLRPMRPFTSIIEAVEPRRTSGRSDREFYSVPWERVIE